MLRSSHRRYSLFPLYRIFVADRFSPCSERGDWLHGYGLQGVYVHRLLGPPSAILGLQAREARASACVCVDAGGPLRTIGGRRGYGLGGKREPSRRDDR